MPRESARERILDAAEGRLLQHGPAGLVLDAVAADAGVSKGGLLYHFASKDALVDALVARMIEGVEKTMAALVAADPDAAGSHTRAYLRSTIGRDGTPADGSARLMAGLLACLGGDPARLEPLRLRFEAWQQGITHDDIDATAASVVRLAADGLWLSALLGLEPPDPQRARAVVAALEALTRE